MKTKKGLSVKLKINGNKVELTDSEIESLFELYGTVQEPEPPKENPRENRWKSFGEVDGWFIDGMSVIIEYHSQQAIYGNKNTYPTRELCEAGLALTQLLQWYHKRIGDYKPDFSNTESKFCVNFANNKIEVSCYTFTNKIFAFRTPQQAKEFVEDYEPLLLKIAPLFHANPKPATDATE